MALQPDRPTRFGEGLAAALPIALGYLPIAFSFGVAATRSGLTETEAFGMSALIYAGAAQFLALQLLSAGTPLLAVAATLVAMNLRHLIYAPALMKRAGGKAGPLSLIWGSGLTDEVFGAALGALARGRRFSEPFMLGLATGAYAAWLTGTATGAWAGGAALERWPVLDAALGFTLPALFLALLLSILNRAQLPVIALAALVTAGVSLAVSPSAGILSGMVAGAAVGLFRRPDAR